MANLGAAIWLSYTFLFPQNGGAQTYHPFRIFKQSLILLILFLHF